MKKYVKLMGNVHGALGFHSYSNGVDLFQLAHLEIRVHLLSHDYKNQSDVFPIFIIVVRDVKHIK